MEKTILTVVFFVIVCFALQGSIEAQEAKAETAAAPASRPYLVRLLFEEGKGVPLLHLDFTTTVAGQKKSEIYVWNDGRIHWRDFSRIETYAYFEAKITEAEVSELLKKVIESKRRSLQLKPAEPGTQHKSGTRFVMGIQSLTSQFVVSSPTYHENNAWSMTLFALAVMNKEDIFRQNDQKQVLEHLASIDDGLLGKKGILKVILYNYYGAEPDNAGRPIEWETMGEFSAEEVEKYVGRFIADAKHFLFCKELMESLIEPVMAQNKTKTSVTLDELANKRIVTKLLWVVEKNDGGRERYEYIPATVESLRRRQP